MHRGLKSVGNGVNCKALKVWEEGRLLALGSTWPVLRAFRMLSLLPPSCFLTPHPLLPFPGMFGVPSVPHSTRHRICHGGDVHLGSTGLLQPTKALPSLPHSVASPTSNLGQHPLPWPQGHTGGHPRSRPSAWCLASNIRKERCESFTWRLPLDYCTEQGWLWLQSKPFLNPFMFLSRSSPI